MNYISQQEPNQMWIKKVLMLVLADILIVLISYFMALLLRFDFVFSSIPEEYLMGYLWSMPFGSSARSSYFISAGYIIVYGDWQA